MPKKPLEDFGTRYCIHCSKEYTPTRYWQKYCSRACSQTAFWTRKVLSPSPPNTITPTQEEEWARRTLAAQEHKEILEEREKAKREEAIERSKELARRISLPTLDDFLNRGLKGDVPWPTPDASAPTATESTNPPNQDKSSAEEDTNAPDKKNNT